MLAKSLRSGRVRLVPGAAGGFVELEGTPGMVLEIVSASSVWKDTKRLLELYWQAKIPESWLVDARREQVQFDIFRYTPEGYVRTRKQGGWVKSAVFAKSFKLTQHADEQGYPEFALAVR